MALELKTRLSSEATEDSDQIGRATRKNTVC